MYHASPYVLSCLCLLAFVVPLGLKTLVCLAALSGATKSLSFVVWRLLVVVLCWLFVGDCCSLFGWLVVVKLFG